jgi:hypothetical protein
MLATVQALLASLAALFAVHEPALREILETVGFQYEDLVARLQAGATDLDTKIKSNQAASKSEKVPEGS